MKYKIVFSDSIKEWNKSHMKERFKEVEKMRFETHEKAEYFITTEFGSSLLYGKALEIVTVK